MRTAIVATVVAALLLAACTTPGHRDVTGTLFSISPLNADTCFRSGHQVVRNGDRIAIQDGAGATLAIGTLGRPAIRDTTCVFISTLPDVPTVESFYRIVLGNPQDDYIVQWDLNRSDLEDKNWTVELDAR